MKKVRSFRISDENCEKVRNLVRSLEGKEYDINKALERKDIRDIVRYCYYRNLSLEDVSSAVEISNALKTLVKSLKDV